MNTTSHCAACSAPVDDFGTYVPPSSAGADVEQDIEEVCDGENCPFSADGLSPDEHSRAHKLLAAAPDAGVNGARHALNRERESAVRAGTDAVLQRLSPSGAQSSRAALVDRA